MSEKRNIPVLVKFSDEEFSVIERTQKAKKYRTRADMFVSLARIAMSGGIDALINDQRRI